MYASNVHRTGDTSYDQLAHKIVNIESKLELWKRGVPQRFSIRTREQMSYESEDTDASRISTVLTLRYLSARMLLHRAVLERALEGDPQNEVQRCKSAFQYNFEKTSLDLCVSAAVDMIDIHHETSQLNRPMLTTWWFSLFYGKSENQVLRMRL